MNGSGVSYEILEYYGGGESLPSIITSKRILDETNGNDRTKPRDIIIKMENTSTMIVETTLFEGTMTFSESGVYEIK